MVFTLNDFDYDLPEELIAQRPTPQRDESRLMVLDRTDGAIRHAHFFDLAQWLPADTLLVINDARVVPVRIWGRRETGGTVEVVIMHPPLSSAGPGEYELECLAKPTRRFRPGVEVVFGPDFRAEVVRVTPEGRTIFRFYFGRSPAVLLDEVGRMPLPPYIRREVGGGPESGMDRERYQTVYARHAGAVAAPTAGLHFTPGVLDGLKARGIEIATLTLLVGYGTFAPVRDGDLTRHRMHPETVIVSASTAEAVNRAKRDGRSITAVGTTVVRSLESLGRENGTIRPFEGETELFIFPGFEFKVVDHLVTNFHLPRSTLVMLVSALAGRERILDAYKQAVAERYRFFSYGDAMLIL